MELKYLLISLISLSLPVFAGPSDNNHIHVEQVNGGKNLDITISQIGFDNEINFSFAHKNNTFDFLQSGNGNYIGWVSYWGSGKNWGGDVDGTGNTETVRQYNGATYGRHIWGNNNEVDVYQEGTHTHNLDIHANSVIHDITQSGTGSHYNHTYFYGTTSTSQTTIVQSGSGSHNSQITIQGNQPTTLNLTQQGGTNMSYNLTQNCFTTGGCTVSVTQGN